MTRQTNYSNIMTKFMMQNTPSRLLFMAYLLSILRNSTVCDRLLLAGSGLIATSANDHKQTFFICQFVGESANAPTCHLINVVQASRASQIFSNTS